jgi:hypothetical protein
MSREDFGFSSNPVLTLVASLSNYVTASFPFMCNS